MNAPQGSENTEQDIWQIFKSRAEVLRNMSMRLGQVSDEEKKAVFKARARDLSFEKGQTQKSSEVLHLITFTVLGELFGIEVRYLQEVYEVDQITKIPCTPSLFSGLINYRGIVMSIIDLRVLFNPKVSDQQSPDDYSGLEEETEGQEKQKILIVAHKGNKVGIGIERLDSLLELSREQLNPVSSFFYDKNKTVKHEVEINGVPLLIIDPVELLTDKRLYINEGVS